MKWLLFFKLALAVTTSSRVENLSSLVKTVLIKQNPTFICFLVGPQRVYKKKLKQLLEQVEQAVALHDDGHCIRYIPDKLAVPLEYSIRFYKNIYVSETGSYSRRPKQGRWKVTTEVQDLL